MTQNNIVIEVRKLNKYFADVHAVKNVSLTVKKGEIFGFLGPNGSGKTTTIRMLCGLLTPDEGNGHCLNYDIIKEAYEIKKRTGYMTQHFSLYQEMTVYENLVFMARIYNIKDKQKKIKHILDRFGLTNYSNYLAGHLSGGWKQRLALAASVLHEPQLLLLDEPTAGVDPKARREFWDFIYELSQQGITTLVSTHYMDEAERCTRLAYISFGELLVEGTIKQIIAKINLTTWSVHAESQEELNQLVSVLRKSKNVEQMVVFGHTIHLSSKNSEKLEKTLAPYKKMQQYHFEKVTTNLEDIFISLVNKVEDK